MSNDLISKQPEPSAEIQEILNYLDSTLHPILSPDNWNVYSELHDMVSMLPSAERHGRWVYDEWIGWCCSECGNQAPFWCISAEQNLTIYCPNCGSYMDSGEVRE